MQECTEYARQKYLKNNMRKNVVDELVLLKDSYEKGLIGFEEYINTRKDLLEFGFVQVYSNTL